MDDFIVENNVNESLDNLDRILMIEFNNCFPIISKHVSRREQKNQWITTEIKQQIKRKEYFRKLLYASRMSRREYIILSVIMFQIQLELLREIIMT